MKLEVKEINKRLYKIYAPNGQRLGNFELDIDGSFYFWQNEKSTGFWTTWVLRTIADELDLLNKPFDKELELYFKMDFEERARVEYRKMLNKSDMFFEFYPLLTGQWQKDKLEWFKIYEEIELLRQDKVSF